ncbi:hypothetical protein Tco_1068603 [Tanacetum coccineum]|uniref:Uncharacterized protein n=1 Tax=Tanacetum coccineum TaxID=301880 RepID=A0ABQ5HGC6_9ASTR
MSSAEAEYVALSGKLVLKSRNQYYDPTRTRGSTKDNPKLEIAVLSDTNVFTMKMEILLEPASNKLLVGDLRDSLMDQTCDTGYRFGPVYELTVDEF